MPRRLPGLQGAKKFLHLELQGPKRLTSQPFHFISLHRLSSFLYQGYLGTYFPSTCRFQLENYPIEIKISNKGMWMFATEISLYWTNKNRNVQPPWTSCLIMICFSYALMNYLYMQWKFQVAVQLYMRNWFGNINNNKTKLLKKTLYMFINFCKHKEKLIGYTPSSYHWLCNRKWNCVVWGYELFICLILIIISMLCCGFLCNLENKWIIRI